MVSAYNLAANAATLESRCKSLETFNPTGKLINWMTAHRNQYKQKDMGPVFWYVPSTPRRVEWMCNALTSYAYAASAENSKTKLRGGMVQCGTFGFDSLYR